MSKNHKSSSSASLSRKIDLNRDVEKALLRLERSQPRHAKQVGRKLLMLSENPLQPDTAHLKGFEGFYRSDIGEYRIIFRFDERCVYIEGFGKRNDSDVYKQFKRSH